MINKEIQQVVSSGVFTLDEIAALFRISDDTLVDHLKNRKPFDPVYLDYLALAAQQRADLFGGVKRRIHKEKPNVNMVEKSEFFGRVHERIQKSDTNTVRFLVFIDIDNMKIINKDSGHIGGDRAISEMAKRFANACRGDDLVCRFGGDEFIALLSGKDEVSIIEMEAEFDKRLNKRKYDGVDMRASVGVAKGIIQPETWMADLCALIDEADRRMMESKEAAKIG